MTDRELNQQTVSQLARQIQARKVSPIEVAKAFIDRCTRLDPTINAFITDTHEAAIKQARRAEHEIASGNYRGPLHGIPVALKDLFWTKGVRTTSGSGVTSEFIPNESATVVTKLENAGAYSIGKTNMVEYAYGGAEHNELYGSPLNPWDTSRVTGGSSSGSAAAVAASMIPVALGSDTAGSVRSPASLCGLSGIKPTYGLISKYGVTPLSWSQDHVGPIAHTVEDLAIVMNALAGFDARDPSSVSRAAIDYVAGLDIDVEGLKIGVPSNHIWEIMHPEVHDAFWVAMETLIEQGITVESVDIPELEYISAAQVTITLAEATAFHADMVRAHPEKYHPGVRRRIETGFFLPAVGYIDAIRIRSLMERKWAELFDSYDLIATPTNPVFAPHFGASEIGTSVGPITTRELVRLTRLFNPNGLPAISVPGGFSSEGMPIGLQIAGKQFNDDLVLAVANRYQQATDWHSRRPPI